MIEANKGFPTRLKAHKQLSVLRASLQAHHDRMMIKSVTPRHEGRVTFIPATSAGNVGVPRLFDTLCLSLSEAVATRDRSVGIVLFTALFVRAGFAGGFATLPRLRRATQHPSNHFITSPSELMFVDANNALLELVPMRRCGAKSERSSARVRLVHRRIEVRGRRPAAGEAMRAKASGRGRGECCERGKDTLQGTSYVRRAACPCDLLPGLSCEIARLAKGRPLRPAD
jgi:hypothetical protein